MKLGRIIGKVWATQKDHRLNGIKLYLLQPVDETDKPLGKPQVAADAVGSREGDLVFWVGGAEACLPFKSKTIPSDVTIVGLVDRTDL
jgi:ethanolamine utilization protein EutN